MAKEFHIPQAYNNHYDPNDPEKKQEIEIEKPSIVSMMNSPFLLSI
jgi:hypothetical protein